MASWLIGVTRKPSPNHSTRSCRPEVIIIHSTGGSYGGALATLRNPAAAVSAHFLIGRDGKTVQLIPLDLTAWHAGKAEWHGRHDVNNLSVGIELEHIDGKQDWPDAQITALGVIIARLRGIYGEIPVTTHAAVARPKGRKVDPVKPPWSRISAAVEKARA